MRFTFQILTEAIIITLQAVVRGLLNNLFAILCDILTTYNTAFYELKHFLLIHIAPIVQHMANGRCTKYKTHIVLTAVYAGAKAAI